MPVNIDIFSHTSYEAQNSLIPFWNTQFLPVNNRINTSKKKTSKDVSELKR